MLLVCLIAFGLAGIVLRHIPISRSILTLLLSTGCIIIISPFSALFCFLIAALNFFLLQHVTKKKWLFFLSVFMNVVLLLFFHVYENLYKEFYWLNIPVLVGVSYLVLQFIDYLCKVRFAIIPSPKSFLHYLAGVLYVPKFFSGPIASIPDVERDLLRNSNAPIAYGINRVLLGLFKKLVLAESLAPVVHSVLDFKEAYPGLTILTGACLFALQLYFDFSGYSDIAIGVSSFWSVTLPENFNFPFRQKSWSNFWKSWHSSLTHWLWQYLFNPLYLSLSRKKINKIFIQFCGIILVFAGMAFFNGLRLGFFISAWIFSFFYLLELFFSKGKNFLSGIGIFICFSVGLIYFRNTDVEEYTILTNQLLDLKNSIPSDWALSYFTPLASGGTQQDYFNLLVTFILSLSFMFFERKIFAVFSAIKINYLACFLLIVLLFLWGVFGNGERFIYMQF